jgi:hypothetical protein
MRCEQRPTSSSSSPRHPPRFAQCADGSGAQRDLVVAGGGHLLQAELVRRHESHTRRRPPDPGGARRRRRPTRISSRERPRAASCPGELVAGSAPMLPEELAAGSSPTPLRIAPGAHPPTRDPSTPRRPPQRESSWSLQPRTNRGRRVLLGNEVLDFLPLSSINRVPHQQKCNK